MNDKIQAANTNSSNDFSALFNYPALGKIFDGNRGASALAAMRTELKNTIQQLERVHRQGPQQDAARAERIVQAYQTTLKLLDELENLSKTS